MISNKQKNHNNFQSHKRQNNKAVNIESIQISKDIQKMCIYRIISYIYESLLIQKCVLCLEKRAKKQCFGPIILLWHVNSLWMVNLWFTAAVVDDVVVRRTLLTIMIIIIKKYSEWMPFCVAAIQIYSLKNNLATVWWKEEEDFRSRIRCTVKFLYSIDISLCIA